MYKLLDFFFQFADPIFSFSPLAIHTRNLLAEPRCTVVVQVNSFDPFALMEFLA